MGTSDFGRTVRVAGPMPAPDGVPTVDAMSRSFPSTPRPAAPTPDTERLLAPDLRRGPARMRAAVLVPIPVIVATTAVVWIRTRRRGPARTPQLMAT